MDLATCHVRVFLKIGPPFWTQKNGKKLPRRVQLILQKHPFILRFLRGPPKKRCSFWFPFTTHQKRYHKRHPHLTPPKRSHQGTPSIAEAGTSRPARQGFPAYRNDWNGRRIGKGTILENSVLKPILENSNAFFVTQ